MKIEDKNSF